MTTPDPISLLRELRPSSDAVPDEQQLERILQAPPETRPGRATRTRLVRPLALAGTLAVVATAVLAIAPSSDGPAVPGVLERASAALSKPGTIMHLRATLRSTDPGTTGTSTLESWQTADGKRERTVADGGTEEIARDNVDRTYRYYTRRSNRIDLLNNPLFFEQLADDPVEQAGGGLTTPVSVGDLQKLLRSAQRGTEGVQLLGRTTIRGIRVERIRIAGKLRLLSPEAAEDDSLRSIKDAPGVDLKATRDVYVRTDDFLPVRVVHRLDDFPDSGIDTVDFDLAEQLPLNARTEGLLKMGEHPGAKVRDRRRDW